MVKNHKIYTYPPDEHNRCYWECSCGRSGSAPEITVDLASDRHIGPNEMRMDTNKPI